MKIRIHSMMLITGMLVLGHCRMVSGWNICHNPTPQADMFTGEMRPASDETEVKLYVFIDKQPWHTKQRYFDMLKKQSIGDTVIRALTLTANVAVCVCGNPEIVPAIGIASNVFKKLWTMTIQALNASSIYTLKRGAKFDWNWKDIQKDRAKDVGQFDPDTAFVVVTDKKDNFLGSFYFLIGGGTGINIVSEGVMGWKGKTLYNTLQDPNNKNWK